MPYEVIEVANYYDLIQIGLSWQDIQQIPAHVAENLLILHSKIKEKEKKDLKKKR